MERVEPPVFRGPEPRGIRAMARRLALDLALGAAGLACLWVFVRGAYRSGDAIHAGPVGWLKSGSAERRRAGSTELASVALGGEFLNMDSIWVGAGKSAELLLYDDTILNLSEKTLILLKRPFRGRDLATGRVRVVQGKAEARDAGGKKRSTLLPGDPRPIDESVPEAEVEESVPAPAPTPHTGKAARAEPTFAPKPDSVVYLKPGADLLFAWPERLTGYLEVARAGAPPVFRELSSANSASIDKLVPGRYSWRVLDSSKETVHGPFRFEAKAIQGNALEDMMRKALDGKSGSVDVHF